MEVLALALIVFIVITLQGFVYQKLYFKKLDYTCTFSRSKAREGDQLFLTETVRNRKLLPLPWLKVSIHSSCWLEYAGTKSTVTQEGRMVISSFFLRGYQKITRHWKLKCLKRGLFTIHNVTLVGSDLLGGKTLSIAVPVNSTLLVYPGFVDLDSLFVPANFLQGDMVVKRWIVEDPFLVSGVREYTPWDPMNRIYWQATAKEGRLMVRKNDYTSQLSLAVILNIQYLENEYFSTVNKEVLEFGIKAAASLLDHAAGMGMSVRFATNGTTLDGGNQTVFTAESAGEEHLDGLMEILAKLELKRVEHFEEFLLHVEDRLSSSQVFFITAYVNQDIYEHALYLKSRGNHVTILLLSTLGGEDVPGGIDLFRMAGTETNNE